MKINEIEIIGDQIFPYAEAEKRLAIASPRGAFEEFDLYYAEQGDFRTLILVDDKKNIAALVTFKSQINGRIWQAKNAVSYAPFKGRQLVGKLYKYVKEQIKKSIQSDDQQSVAGKKLWTKTLPALGLKPMIFDTETERIIDPTTSDIDVYAGEYDISGPATQAASQWRYCWILEKFDHYPSQNLMNEDSLLMPYRGLWYNPNKTKEK